MKMRTRLRLPMLLLIIATLSTFAMSAFAEDAAVIREGHVQVIEGNLREAVDIYHLPNLEAGRTLYLYVESAAFNPSLVVGDRDFDNVFMIGQGDGDSAMLTFEIPTAGDYSMAVTSGTEDLGNYRLSIGIDVPSVLTGNAMPTGGAIAILQIETGTQPAPDSAFGNCDDLQERPVLSGVERIRETTNFIIHYTLEGIDATTEDFVDEVELTFEEVYDIEINQMGWPLPPPDCGEGGDTRFDVYLVEILDGRGVLGYSQPGGIVLDNPITTLVEEWAAYSFMVIDNDFNGTPNPVSIMRATAAHEFHHSIQFGYDVGDREDWLYEGTASWIETQVFPDDEAASPYVGDLFDAPHACLGVDLPFTSRIYAEWLVIDSMAQDYGTSVVQRLWELTIPYEGMDVFYALATELATTPHAIVGRYAVRNLLRDYEIGNRFTTTVRLAATIDGTGEARSNNIGIGELGVAYVSMITSGTFTYSINKPNLHLIVVGVDTTAQTATAFQVGQFGTVNTSAFDQTYVIILNTDQHRYTNRCHPVDWVLTVDTRVGSMITDGETYGARHFRDPR